MNHLVPKRIFEAIGPQRVLQNFVFSMSLGALAALGERQSPS